MRRILLALGAVIALGACDSTGPNGMGSMSILLTDAAGDVTQAVVKIDRIEIVGGAGGPLVVRDEEWTGDLTLLEGEVEPMVNAFALPQGSYSQLRLVISEACIGVSTGDGHEPAADDEVYVSPGASAEVRDKCIGVDVAGDLQMPSYAQTGIKVIFQGPLEIGSEPTTVLLDFVVSESFGKLAGGSGQWVMDPTIHGIDVKFLGTVNLTVEPADFEFPDGVAFEDFTATLDDVNLPLEENGTASFMYLLPDTYYLTLTPPDTWTMTTTEVLPIEVVLGSGEVEEVTITLEDLTQ